MGYSPQMQQPLQSPMQQSMPWDYAAGANMGYSPQMQQPLQSPMQQSMPWDYAAGADMGYSPTDANYANTMPYSFPATHPTAYMMPCYPMSREMSYPYAMELPYSMPYPYSNMPHENNAAGQDDQNNIEVRQAVEETQTKQEGKAPRKSTTNRTVKPAADDRATLHQFLQRRASAEPVKEVKSTSPWINY
jgi:hypothetical protein